MSCSLPFRFICTCIAVLLFHIQIGKAAELVIHIPGNLNQDGVVYRLDYYPPFGHPEPNTTIASKDIHDVITFSKALPGTKYDFWLYYSNSTHNTLTWTANFTTVPDPPSNLSVIARNGKVAVISWSPPSQGSYSTFKLRINALSTSIEPKPQTIIVDDVETTLKDLTPGATYQVQAYTVFENKESAAYTSRNFTTKPNTPGKFIVWFRNETTLLVLWQPPYPPAIYSHYKVSIEPNDAIDSILYVEKEGEPPGPAQAAFKGLVPGRAYNISVQTMSEDEISTPTTAQYRTVPLRPLNITFDKASITSNSFVVRWDPPNGKCEFDKYQISLGPGRKHQGVTKLRDEQPMVKFKDLDPGKTYQVIVKIVSGKVTSWPMQAEVTLKPLPVTNLYADVDLNSNTVIISWTPNVNSNQSAYLVSYHEVESSTGDSNTITTNETKISLDALLPGRNYSIAVQAISKKTESNESFLYVVTRPSAPIIEDLRPLVDGLNISWKSDVNSRQDKYEVECVRNDTNDFILRTTYESRIVLTHLYPGAGYMVKVFAISHGRKSEPHEYFQPVFPRPPTNMTIEKTTTNSVIVQWQAPLDSLVTEYAIRYRTDSDRTWVRLPAVQNLEAEVTDMTPGERYTIQVNTVSYGLESNEPQQLNHTVRPNPVSNIAPLVDSNNVTLEWPRPEGRVEIYIVRWWEAVTNPVQINKRNVSQNNNTTGPVRLLVGDLMPGVEYDFDIQAISNDLESDITPLKIRTMPLIQSEVVVVNNQISTDSISLRYTPTPQTSSKFDLYRFSLSETNIPDQEKDANDTDTLVKFTGLIPGRLYNITVWTVSQNVASQPLQRQDRLYPEPITGINSTHSSETEVTLSWALPRGEYNAFEVQYLTSENVLIQNLTLYNSITITDLKPHRNYTFTVIVRSGTESSILRRSLPFSSTFMTQESVPGKVDKFYPIDIQPSEITFNWSLPSSEHNGVILRFTITYGLDGSSHTIIREFGSDKFSGIIRQLEPGRKYVFKIQAETKVGYGPEAILFQKMPILAPPKPGPQVVPTEVCKSSTTIQIRFRKNYFSEQNGAVISYTIIVAEDDSKNSSGLEMPSWRDVQAYSVWPPFQIMEPYYPFQNSSVEDFTIGADSCDVRHTGYCNGPLKSGSTYKVKVRAFTAPDKFTDTSYSFPLQTDQNNTPIILGIVIPLVLILPIIIVVLVRRKRAQGRNATESRTDNMSLPDSVIETSRPIHIENFANHYRIMSADSDFRFSEEFEELKHVGSDQPCSFADLPCNRPKNRFTNILPYDHSRYKLQPVDDEEGSDYINANYVPGHSSPREFIVTQGPLHSTRDDFWRMCWESNSRAIIMLTRCVEKGREKCDHYWPYDTVPVYYGDISVQILNESRYPDWNISEFMVCRGDIQRVIRHFHFTSWPDFGVPNPPHTLVRFVRAFREKVGSDQRPIVVHCSAGVGRSGTFICLDRILQQIRNYDYVDIFGIVYAMRKERVWMVQTEQQYICIYQCLLVVLEGKEVTGPPREIHENQGFEGKGVGNGAVDQSLGPGEKER